MIDRLFYKTRAKVNLKGKWIAAALISVILMLASGNEIIRINSNNNAANQNMFNNGMMNNLPDYFNNGAQRSLDYITPYVPYGNMMQGSGISNLIPVFGLIFIPIFIIIIAAGIAFQSFVMGPLALGAYNYFRKNDLNEVRPEIGEILWAFRSPHYLNIVKILFLQNIKLFGWYLLLIVPGIIKSYEYSMIPYILSRNPETPSNEVFASTRDLTLGRKSSLFVLDLSFIGWYILGSIPFGIGTPFVKAYETQTKSGIFNDWIGDTSPIAGDRQ